MVVRATAGLKTISKSRKHLKKPLLSNHYYSLPPLLHRHSLLRRSSFCDLICKAFYHEPEAENPCKLPAFQLQARLWIHSCTHMNSAELPAEKAPSDKSADVGNAGEIAGATKMKRKKLKGKRAVVRWLKFFRYKKKKEYERMTAEEKILYKLRKARKKEERMIESLKKLEPKETSETAHDPEILSPEEHFYFLKMGLKCKNYVPVGRRGIYQGVILNMHLHWKKHQTLQVIVKTFTPEEVKEIAVELARLTGGIVLGIHEENTIIMYRGKNYVQPPTEIMSPRVTLSRKKALDKSKYRDGLRAVRRYIPRLQQDLELLQAHAKNQAENINEPIPELQSAENSVTNSADPSNPGSRYSARLRELIGEGNSSSDDVDSITDLDDELDSGALSDIFETESDSDAEEIVEKPLYLDAFERIPVNKDDGSGDFEAHLRQISMNARSKKSKSGIIDCNTPDFDEERAEEVWRRKVMAAMLQVLKLSFLFNPRPVSLTRLLPNSNFFIPRGDGSVGMRRYAAADSGHIVPRKKKRRLDEVCLERYEQYSRTFIQSWILQGKVFVDGKKVTKAGTPVSDKSAVEIHAEVPKYVCRAGHKLEAAIEKLDLHVTGKVALDSGLSTGGFTDCLLQHGASFVYGIDVGYGQVADKIRRDERVSVIERTNLRYLTELPQKVDLVTLDLSFISILKVIPAVMKIMKEEAELVTLVKPQFEAHRSQVGGGGIVRDPKVHQEVLDRIIKGVEEFGFERKGWIESPLKGAEGNTEFLVHFTRAIEKTSIPESQISSSLSTVEDADKLIE
ncbi:unnamed protein product [Rhodiola kirilowii]